jgi:hypothetical protein
MNPQHLSDEAVAAFADGVLSGHARERATRHINACGECHHAVRVQREAAFALRSAVAPALPSALRDRLRTVPMTTPVTTLPTAITPEGNTVLSTFAPMAALVPNPATSTPNRSPHRAHSPRTHSPLKARPFVTTAAIVALAGALTAGSVARDDDPAQTGTGTVVRQATPSTGTQPVVVSPVMFFRGAPR